VRVPSTTDASLLAMQNRCVRSRLRYQQCVQLEAVCFCGGGGLVMSGTSTWTGVARAPNLSAPFPRREEAGDRASERLPHIEVKNRTPPPSPFLCILTSAPSLTAVSGAAAHTALSRATLSLATRTRDSLWSQQRLRQHHGRGSVPPRSPNCFCPAVPAHPQQLATPLR
jgi:hypothetical protein